MKSKSDTELMKRLAKRDAPRPKTESEKAFINMQKRMRLTAKAKYDEAAWKLNPKRKPTQQTYFEGLP